MTEMVHLEEQLSSFDPDERQAALQLLLDHHVQPAPLSDNVNMHCHSFHSYNAHAWSPTRIAWETYEQGLYANALTDFDVLDGLEEFLNAGLTLGVRSAVHVETRAFLNEFKDCDINSPGEPGVTYVMGAGFARVPEPGSGPAETLTALREQARQRNIELIERINAALPDAAIDYDRDVLGLTPGGAATERHIVSAYINHSEESLGSEGDWAAYWSPILGADEATLIALRADRPALEELVRKKLAKGGGIGYVQPSEKTFPPVDDFFAWVKSCDAIPMDTWLDGLTEGEARDEELLECMRAKGAAAVNIVPDRNWNLSDPAAAKQKHDSLTRFVKLADRLQMPINIGTEMNKLGLPPFDDLDGEALKPFKDSFISGACIMVGHTIALRHANVGYAGANADAEFGGDTGKKNDFFRAVGHLPPLTHAAADSLTNLGSEQAYARLHDSIKNDGWMV